MILISKVKDEKEETDYWFAVDPEDKSKPFIFGANCADSSLPSIAQWSAASAFSLQTIDSIDGTLWKDWRVSLIRTGCPQAISIFEKALTSIDKSIDDVTHATINEILKLADMQ